MKRPDWLKLPSPVALGLVAVGILGLGLVVYLPQWQTASLRKGVEDYRASRPKPDPKEPATSEKGSLPKPDPEKLATLEKGRIDSENAIRTGLIQGIGGTAVLIGIYFTYRNLRTAEANLEATQRNVLIAAEKQATERKTAEANLKLAEAKQITDRFSKAVEMLSSGSMYTRLGGIYALERIARDSDDDYWQVMEVLTAFVREESPWPPKQSNAVETSTLMTEESELPPLRMHIQEVMTVIGRRKHRFLEGEIRRLDLRQTDLRKLQAQGAHLAGVRLTGAHLEDANLWGAHLEDADLGRAHLEDADLSQVPDLTQAQLDSAFTDEHTILPDYLLATQPPSQAPIASPSPATPDPNSEPHPPQPES